jgi:hypothetical protein
MAIWIAYVTFFIPTALILLYVRLVHREPALESAAPSITPMRRRVVALERAANNTWPHRFSRMFKSTWVCCFSVASFYLFLVWMAW